MIEARIIETIDSFLQYKLGLVVPVWCLISNLPLLDNIIQHYGTNYVNKVDGAVIIGYGGNNPLDYTCHISLCAVTNYTGQQVEDSLRYLRYKGKKLGFEWGWKEKELQYEQ